MRTDVPPPAPELDDELLRALQRLLHAPLSIDERTVRTDDAVLARSWLSAALARLRHCQERDPDHLTTSEWSRRRILVAVLNSCDADVAAVLEAEDSRTVIAAVYAGVRAAIVAWAEDGKCETAIGCGCRARYWQASLVGAEDGTQVWEHRCEWCGATEREVGRQPTRPAAPVRDA